MIKVLKFYKSVWHEWRLLYNLVTIFQVKNVATEKNKKTLNIFYTIEPIFINFH